ncbi:MAG: aminotransferase class V-fold PLP-dependent enzyme, partial [Candidatus Uhrbacteria bacterium]|nr:aminotransferase class V-fold PLP-dependent enzyme [Candidatus Uhrbacteria bacterium]
EALRLAQETRGEESGRLIQLRDQLIDGIAKKLPNAVLNGHRTQRLPNNINISIPGIEGEELVIRLDAHGIAASTASACKGGSEMSHVLRALHISDARVLGSIRLSLGQQTRATDIRYVLRTLPEIVAQMR